MFDPARLRGYRHARSTRTALATTTGIPPAVLDAIENGTHTPGPATITALAHTLGCAPDDLHSPPDQPPNTGYWQAVTNTMPRMNTTEVADAASALDRATTPDTP